MNKKGVEREEWYIKKECVANAFSSLHFARDLCLTDKEIRNISLCLTFLNDYLNNDKPE